MTTDPVNIIEYETMVFARYLSSQSGRTRRTLGVLDQSAYMLLSVLHVAGPQSISELKTVTGLDASTLNRQTAALLRDDLAERIADPSGGVARKFTTTAQGVTLLQGEREASREAMRGLMGEWSDADRDAFADLLGRLNRAIEDYSGRDWPRPDFAS
ncbi:MAG TPA: MarR family transcriptional regulator [Microbacterium sp.]|uniref:MarR family winged helix-turn-helix transcriptional regulator n=1 Tax=Microbacterium sp. TaxID=51671 RepID=UPI000EBD1A5A|nr:MarR family transcriptional regulator [Microbacterium sp.]